MCQRHGTQSLAVDPPSCQRGQSMLRQQLPKPNPALRRIGFDDSRNLAWTAAVCGCFANGEAIPYFALDCSLGSKPCLILQREICRYRFTSQPPFSLCMSQPTAPA